MSSSSQEAPDDPRARRAWRVVGTLVVLVVGLAAWNLVTGPVPVPAGEVMTALGRALGLPWGDDPGPRVSAVVVTIRLPRVLVAIVAGAAAGVTGAALQGLFRNPIADPHLLGIGPGAALGAALGSVSGSVAGAGAGGAVGGILSALVVRRLGARRGGDGNRFILSGVALGAAISAWLGFVVFVADRTRVPPIDFWLLGSLAGADWAALGVVVTASGLALLGLFGASHTLDLLALGEVDARRLGVDVPMATFAILVAAGCAIGAAVGVAGVVAFVGLVVPHVIRRVAGPGHRLLLPASALGGAAMMLLAELIARTVVSPQEIPVGLVTAAVGGPFFLWLIGRAPRERR